MAVRLGQSPEDLAKGMYNVVSATFDGESALKVLETSAEGALAGLSDTATVTGLLTKTLQAYRKEGETNAKVAAGSADVMDTYFMAVNRGMFTFDELANKMGALPATASAFGVSLQDLMGFLSTATVRGVGLDEAIVGVRQSLIQIAKITPQTAKAAEELFGKDWKEWWSAAGLAEHGLYGTLEKLQEFLPQIDRNLLEVAASMEDEGGDAFAFLAQQTGASVDALAALFPNIRALKAILAVSGPGMALYAENMGYMEKRAGATGRALEEMEKSGSLAMAKFKSMLAVIGLDVGGLVLPLLTDFGNSAVAWYGGLQAEFAEEGGLFETDAWMMGIPDSQAEQQMKIAAQRFWDAADPGDRLAFTIDSAHQKIVDWWGSPEVQATIDDWSKKIEEGVKAALESAFEWLKKELTAWATEIPDRMKATITGGTSDPEGMRAQDWVIGAAAIGIATNVATTLAGWFGIGGGAAAVAGGGAAAGGAGGAAGGGLLATAWSALSMSTFGTAVGVAFLNVAPAVGAAMAAAIIPALVIGGGALMARAGMMEHVPDPFMGSAYKTRRVAAAAKAAYPDDPMKQLGFINAQPRAGIGMGGRPALDMGTGLDWSDPFGGKVWDEAAGGFVAPANTMEDAGQKQSAAADRLAFAVSKFGMWVHQMPSGGFPAGGAGLPSPPIIGGGHQPSARGFSGMVYSPKTFTVGEGGRPEHVQITPSGKGRGGGGLGGLTIQGDLKIVSNASDPKQVAAYVVRELEKAASNG
jgi:hypothetical protein